MGVKFSTIKGLTQKDVALWRNGDLFIDFKNNDVHAYDSVLDLYKEYTYRENNNHTSFNTWCLENELYSAYFGNDNWYWEIIELNDNEVILVIAQKL